MNKTIPQDYVLTPHGLRHLSDVRLVADDDRQLIQPPLHPPTSVDQLRQLGPGGWLVSAYFPPSEPLKSMHVTFTVPEPPLKRGALIYLFPAAENAFLNTILQPVLQYGNNGYFGGDCWTVACWHATSNGVSRYSTPIDDVKPHDTIVGTIKILEYHDDSCDWLVEARVLREGSEPRHTKLHAYGLETLFLFLAAGALEAYSLDDLNSLPNPSQYPDSGSTQFRDIRLESLTENLFRANWRTRITPAECGFAVNVSPDRSAVTLEYP